MKTKLVAKTPNEIVLMKKACEITKKTLEYAEKQIRPGISTLDLDKLIKKVYNR